jgi:hypothetical protein
MQPYVTVPVMMVASANRKFPARAAEWMTASMVTTMGLAFAGWPRMFATSDYLSELRDFAPQSFWAATLLAIGCMRLSALFINGSWRPSPHLRLAGAVLSVLVWSKILDGFAHLGRPSPALAIYPWLALADFYAVFRAGRDARRQDDQARASAQTL